MMDSLLEELRNADGTKARQVSLERLEEHLRQPEVSWEPEGFEPVAQQLLEITNDKNFRVSALALECLEHTTFHLKEGFRPLLIPTLKALVARLADMKATVREAAVAVIHSVIRHVSPADRVLEVLIKKMGTLGHRSQYVREETLNLIVWALEDISRTSVPLGDVAAPAARLLEDQSERVREAALRALQTMYRFGGDAVYEEIVKAKVSAPKMRVIHDALDAVDVVPDPVPLNPDDDPRKKRVKPRPRNLRVPASPGAGARGIGSPPGISPHQDGDTPRKVYQWDVERPGPEVVHTDRELVQRLDAIEKTLRDSERDWSQRVAALRQLSAIALGGAADLPSFGAGLRQLQAPVVNQLKDLRSALVREAALCLSILAETTPTSIFESFVVYAAPTILKVASSSVGVIAQSATTCLLDVVRHTPSTRVVPKLIEGTKSNSKLTRLHSFLALCECVEYWPASDTEKCLESILQAVRGGVADAFLDARSAARQCFAALHCRWQARSLRMLVTLDHHTQNLVMEGTRDYKPKPRPAPAAPAATAAPPARKTAWADEVDEALHPYHQGPAEEIDHPSGSSGRALLHGARRELARGDEAEHHKPHIRSDPGTKTGVIERGGAIRILQDDAVRATSDPTATGVGVGVGLGTPTRVGHGPPTPHASHSSSSSSTGHLRGRAGRSAVADAVPGSARHVTSATSAAAAKGPSRVEEPRKALSEGKLVRPASSARRIGVETAGPSSARHTRTGSAGSSTSGGGGARGVGSGALRERASGGGSSGSDRDIVSASENMATVLEKAESSVWTDRVECFQRLKLMCEQSSPEIVHQFEKIVRLYETKLADPHHRVAQIVLDSLADMLACYRTNFEPYLEWIVPRIFPRVYDAKEATRQAASTCIDVLNDCYSAELLVPVLLRVLDDSNAKVRSGCLRYMAGLVLTAHEYFTKVSAMRVCVQKVASFMGEKSVDLHTNTVKCLVALHEVNPDLFLFQLLMLPTNQQSMVKKALLQYIPTLEQNLVAVARGQKIERPREVRSQDDSRARPYDNPLGPLHPSPAGGVYDLEAIANDPIGFDPASYHESADPVGSDEWQAQASHVLSQLRSSDSSEQVQGLYAVLQLADVGSIGEENVAFWIRFAPQVVMAILDCIRLDSEGVSPLALQVLRELAHWHPMAITDAVESTFATLCACASSQHRVVRKQGLDSLKMVADVVELHRAVNALVALVARDQGRTLAFSLDVLGLLLVKSGSGDLVRETIPRVARGVVKALSSEFTDVRKAGTFFLIHVFDVLGDSCWPHLVFLTPHNVKLMTLLLRQDRKTTAVIPPDLKFAQPLSPL
eukprot:Rmarinus@m.9875